MKVEILSESGIPLFDASSRGSVFDWSMKGGDGESVADGSYLCVITVKSVTGKLSQRVGTVSFSGGRPTLLADGRRSPAQDGAVGPIEEDSLIAVMNEVDIPSTTVVGHDGRTGQVTATTGDLTFRTGDVFAGKESERMRITADGKIGIGTDHPETALDVRGTLRASDGYGFMNGSKVTVDDKGTLKVTRADGTESPTVAGTGTQNRVAKWLETGGAGTLGDSNITDTGTNVGIGTTTPQYPLHIVSPTFGQLYVSGGSAADFLMFHTGAPVNTRWTGLRSQGGFGKISSFNDNGTYRIESILTWNNANGFVGVGVPSPQYPIHIDNPTFGQLYVSGGTAADFLMYHTNGPTNAKWTGLRSQGGFGKISSFNDNGTYRNESILVWDNATGNVGVGTLAPTYKLDVNHGGGTGVRVQATSGSPAFSTVDVDSTNGGDSALRFAEAGAFRWIIRSAGSTGVDSLDFFQSGGGSRMQINATTGNITQPLANSGLVKAAAHINGNGTVAVSRQFNNLPAGAAITVVRLGVGQYEVNFGDDVSTRFYQAMLGGAATSSPINPGEIFIEPRSGIVNALFVATYNSAGTATDRDFFLTIY